MENNQPMRTDRAGLLLWVAVLALAALNLAALRQAARTKTELATLKQSLEGRLASLDERAQALETEAEARLAALRTELDEARRLAATRAGQAKSQAEQLVSRLAAEYRKQQQQITDEIGQVRQSAGLANEKVAAVLGDVGAVRGEVAENRSAIEKTRSELESTREELRSVKGDLGIQSGLIATNARELAALKELGERHYIEFDIGKEGQPVRLGNVSVVLRKTKPKEAKFTVEILADDKRIPKRDRTVNEPVQFYVSGYRQPYELVVNEVRKDAIVGYLAIPKQLQAENR